MSPAVPTQSLLPARGHHLPAAGTAALSIGLLLGLAAVSAGLGLLAAVLVLQLGLVLAWVLATGTPDFAGSLAVGAAAAVAVDLVLVLPDRPSLGALLPVLGTGFLAVVLQQMLRRDRHDLVATVAGGALLLTAVAGLGALLLSGHGGGAEGRFVLDVAVIGVAVVVGHLVDLALPRPRLAGGVPRGLLGLASSVGFAGLLAWLLRGPAELSGPQAIAVGAMLGLVAALAAVAASYLVVEATSADPDSGTAPPGPDVSLWSLPVVQAVLPIAAAAPVALALQFVL